MSTEANKVKAMAPLGGTDARRWVVLAQFVLALGIWWSLSQALSLVVKALGFPQYTPGGWSYGAVIGFAITGAALIYTLRNVVAQEFANDVMAELRKVTWPSWKETRQSTVVVIITVFIVGLILGGFDLVWAKLTKWLLSIQ